MNNIVIATEQNINRTIFYAHCTCSFKRISANEFFTDTVDLVGKIGNETMTADTIVDEKFSEKVERTLAKVFRKDDVKFLCLDTVELKSELRQMPIERYLEKSDIVANYR